MKVLIVDDSEFLRTSLRKIVMTVDGLEIREAKDGVDALEQYRLFRPDIVFMDITMPNLDGITSLTILKHFNPQVKIIVCSAMGQKSFVMKALKNGAEQFVVKPFQKDFILNVLNLVMEKTGKR